MGISPIIRHCLLPHRTIFVLCSGAQWCPAKLLKWRKGISHETEIQRRNLHLLRRSGRVIRPCSGAEVLPRGAARPSAASSRLQTLQQPKIQTRELPDDRASFRGEKRGRSGNSQKAGSTSAGKQG